MMITVDDEHRIAARLRTTPVMAADEREAATKLLAAIRKARAEGGRYLHARINGSDVVAIRLA